MLLARVVGNVISTIKMPSHKGHKLMLVEYIDLDGKPYGSRQIVMDAADAGIGDIVLVNVDGGAAQMIIGDAKAVVDYVICGFVDHFDVPGK
jgi:microcompartment protein CcmK/EutM